MRKRLVLAILVALALAATVGLAACGGSGGSGERTTTATETAAQVAPDASKGTPDAAKPGAPRPGGKLALKKVGDFEHPTYVAGAPGYPRLLFVVEQEGQVIAMNGGKKLSRPFLDIRSLTNYDGAERGLLSIAFPPDYKEGGRFYVYFVNNGGSIEIDEYH